MTPHKKIIYIGFGSFAIVKTIIFFFGLIAGILGIGNVFADRDDCSTLTRENIEECCIINNDGEDIDCSDMGISSITDDAFEDYIDVIQSLNLSDNRITNLGFFGWIDESSCDEEGAIKISSLNLSDNIIINLGGVENLRCGLEFLDLSNNKINNISNLKNLSKLTELKLGNNRLYDISTLRDLFKLEEVYLQYNEIDNISPIQSLYNNSDRHLSIVNLEYNCLEITGDTEEFVNNVRLMSLYVDNQKNCSKWTGNNVLISPNYIVENLDIQPEDNCNTGTMYICTGNDTDCNIENYIFSGATYEVTCDDGEICQNDIHFFFLNNGGEQCMLGEMAVRIDKVPPTCIIEQNSEKTGNNIYRPTNKNVQLNVEANDTFGVGKIDYKGYNRGDGWTFDSNLIIHENSGYHVYVKDAVGNTTGCSIVVSNIDRIPPAPATGTKNACFSDSISVNFVEEQHEEGVGFGGSYIVFSTGDNELTCDSERWNNTISFVESVYLNIGVCDEANNITTGGYKYILDRAPITTISGYNWQWTGNDVNLKFNIDDGDEICRKATPSQTHYCTYASGQNECNPDSIGTNALIDCEDDSVCETYIKYFSVNGSGMTESINTGLILIDKQTPSCGLSQYPTSENYTSGDVVLTTIADDGDGSSNIQYNWTGVFGWNNISSGHTNQTYSVNVKDLVGNEKSCNIEVSNIDRTSPTITINPGNENSAKKSREITIIANDNLAGFVGNQKFKYYWSNISDCTDIKADYISNKDFDYYEEGEKTITGKITKSDGDGYKYLCIFGDIEDRAGNISTTSKGGPYLFDNTGPTGSILISYNGLNGYASGYELELTLTGSDTYSDIKDMQFSCNNNNWTEIESFAEHKSFNLPDYEDYGCNTGDGEKTIYVKLIDSLGNIGDTISGKIVLDTVAPNCTIEQSACTSNDLILTLIGNEALTGTDLTNWTFVDSQTYTKGITNNNTVSIIVKDLAGNSKSCNITPTNFDDVGPTITFEDTSIEECSSKSWIASAVDSGCAGIGDNAYKFSTTNFGDGNWGSASLMITTGQVLSGGMDRKQDLTVRDIKGNTSVTSATLTIIDTKPTIATITGQIQGLLTGERTYGNIVSLLGVNDGACGTGTITASLVGKCTNAVGSTIQNNILTINPDKNIEGTGICTIEFKDDEGNSITGFVVYDIDTRRPDVAECTANACFKDKVVVSCSENENQVGNKIVYSTGNDISCNSPIWSTKTFTRSTTLKVAVCDSVGHISDISTYQYNLDNQSPNTTLSGLPTGWTGNNLNLGFSAQDNCEKVDTYYCLTGINNTCINTDYKKLSGNSIGTVCPVGQLCEYTIWYYSVDGAGNQEAIKSGSMQIDMKQLTCDISFDENLCTNSGITLTLNVSKPIVNDLGLWTLVSGEENKYSMTIQGNSEVSVDVYDHINNSYTCTASVNNFDNKSPIVYADELYTGYECEDILIAPEIIDDGCNKGLTYIWGNTTGNIEYQAIWSNNNHLGINNINLAVIDAAGNRTDKKIKYQWINRPITGQDFEVENVGTGISVNWKLRGNVSAGKCESELITSILVDSGSIGDCILNGDILEYKPHPGKIGNDVCILTVSDGDGQISISAIWKGIDDDNPIVINYTGGFGDICTNKKDTKVLLSFNETVNGIFEDSITGYNVNISNFSSGNNGSEYSWDIELSGEGTGEIWIDTNDIRDIAGNLLSGNINHIYLGYYDIIGPSIPSLLNYVGGETSENASIILQWGNSITTGCASFEKYEINVCTDIDMSEGCKIYESFTNEKTIVRENGEFYRQVVAIDTNGNKSYSEKGHFVINSSIPTCVIESIGTCTSGAVELQLKASESISFVNMGGIDWDGNGEDWIGSVSENMIINGIIIKDSDGYTGTCDEFIVSSFDDIAPTTTISGTLSQIEGKYRSRDDLHFELRGIDEGCGNEGISTYYCISDTNECDSFVQGTNIHISGQNGNISTKYLKYYSIDSAGNKEEEKSIEITIDKQGPACEIEKSISNKTNSSIIISLSGNDGTGIGLSLYPYAWYPEKNWVSQNTLVIRENGLYTGYISDILGNESACNIDIDNIDTIPPEGVTCNVNSNTCFTDTLPVTCEEKFHEDGNTIVYTTDGTNPSCSSSSRNNFSFTGDTILKIAVCDSVGNISNISAYTYVIDDESPITTIEGVPSGDGWAGNNLLITLSSIDYGCAGGINAYYCLYDSGDTCDNFSTGTEISVSCDTGDTCIKYLEYYSTDSIGNKEETKRHIIKIDRQGPTCEIIQTPSSATYTSGPVVLEVIGNDGVGIKSFVWSGNLGKQKRLSINENGVYSVTVSDILGNQSQCSINVSNIDNIKPQGVNCNIISCTSGSLNISCTQTKSESGNKIVYTTNGLSPNCESDIWNNKSFSGATTLKIAVCDEIGNMSDVSTFNYTQNDFSNHCSSIDTGDNTGTGDSSSGSINSGDINTGSTTSGDITEIDTGASVITSGTNIYCLTSWNNDKFIDETFRDKYDGNTEEGHGQLVCALFGYSGDYETAYTLGRSGYDGSPCTGMTVIETGILPDTLESNTIYVLNAEKLVTSHRITMGDCAAIISKNGTIIYSNKYFDEHTDVSMVRTNTYTILDNINIDGINNGTGGQHIRNYHGIDTYGDSTLNNMKTYHNGHGILVAGKHINLNNIQTFGNDGVGIWESSSLSNTNTYNTYNNLQSYNNKTAGLYLRGLNSVLNNTMVYNNGNDTGSVSWNSITNPKDNNGNYLINRTSGGITNAKGLKTIGEIVGYSYGMGIKTQQQPVVYKGNTLISGGSFDGSKYIGSNVLKITGDTEIKYDSRYGDLNFVGKSSNSGISKYTLFIMGNTGTGLTISGIDLGKSTWAKNSGYNNVVTQLWGDNYFATHYQKSISISGTQQVDDVCPKYERFVPDTSRYNWAFSDEMNEAYQYSHEYNITTMPDIIWADMYGNLTRIAMAKMISNYAINILGIVPDSTKINRFNDVSDNLDYQYDYGVQKAYQLGIMGQNMPNNEFRPYDLVTRAEFATALSRLLFNMEDGKPYYEPHIYMLHKLGIISNTNPDLQERRGYVMLMLLRYHQHNSL